MSYADVNGVRIWYEEAGEGDPVVLLHAGLVDSRIWEPQWEAFAARRRVVRFDAPAFGRSEPPPREYVLADCLAGLLDALGIERAALVGNSMGGAAEIDFALAQPGRVSALVAVGPGLSGFSFRAYTDEQDARAEAAWDARDLAALADLWLEVWAPLGADEPLRTIAHENAKVLTAPDEVKPDPPAAGRLRELAAPTLVVVGDHEHPGIREICDLIAAEVPGARLEVLADADHLPAYRQPERFNELVLGFLSDLE